jgi:hypothetical protein
LSRGNIRLLGQLREDRQSERSGSLPLWPAFTNTDGKVLYLGDPMMGGVADINRLRVFDVVYMMVRGKPFAAP